jgi:hypothetical protein
LAHLSSCLLQCPNQYKAVNGYCVCSNSSLLTINDKCVSLPGCPIKMSFDSFSQSCLSCPFGCMSCNNTVCSSCNPGYFLYVSPQGIRCRRKSPLFPCDKQYSLVQGVCLVTDYANLNMNLCLNAIPNCKVCVPSNVEVCALCQDGYYIFNNKCYQNCPLGLIKYENACIVTQILNCSLPHLITKRAPALITIKQI